MRVISSPSIHSGEQWWIEATRPFVVLWSNAGLPHCHRYMHILYILYLQYTST